MYFKTEKNWKGIKKLLFVVAHRRFRKLKSIQTVVGKVSRGNLQARLQFLFPKTKVTSTFAVGFCIANTNGEETIGTKLRVTHSRRNIFRVGPKVSHNRNMIIILA